MPRLRLVLALCLPTLLVAWGMLGLRDVRATFLLYTLGGCVLGPSLLLGLRPLRSDGGLPFRAGRGRLVAALLQAAVFGLGLWGAYAVGRHWLADPVALQSKLADLHWSAEDTPVYSALFVLLIPLVEEWWWRGQALPRCRRAFGPGPGLLAAGVGFGAYHVIVLSTLYTPGSALLRSTAIVAAGFFWCFWALRRGSWVETFAGHLGTSVAVVVAFALYFT